MGMRCSYCKKDIVGTGITEGNKLFCSQKCQYGYLEDLASAAPSEAPAEWEFQKVKGDSYTFYFVGILIVLMGIFLIFFPEYAPRWGRYAMHGWIEVLFGILVIGGAFAKSQKEKNERNR